MPSQLRVSQVQVPLGADWFVDQNDTQQRLTVNLAEPMTGSLELALSGTVARERGDEEFVVPRVTYAQAHSQQGQLAVYLADDLEGVLEESDGAESMDPAALDQSLLADTAEVDYAFRCQSPYRPLRLRLVPAASRSSAEVVEVVSIRDGAVAYVASVDFEIRQAGRSLFQLVTPLWLGEDLQVIGDQIRQVSSAVADGERVWSVQLQQPQRERYQLQVRQTITLLADGTIRAACLRPLDVDRWRRHLVLENLTGDEVSATTTGGATPVSPADVPGSLDERVRRRAVAAFRVNTDTNELVWQRRVREQELGLAATINLVDLTTVIHEDGRYRARAAYNIRNFTLQFLELELPAKCQIWSVHVSAQPVRPASVQRQGRTITLLPLQKTSAGDFSSKVVMLYSGRLDEPLSRWSQVRPPAPQIISDVPVSRTLWTVLLPRSYHVSLVKRASNVEEVAAAYHQQERKLSFLDELQQMVQVASMRTKSGAGAKARQNLKQVGASLQDYAQESTAWMLRMRASSSSKRSNCRPISGGWKKPTPTAWHDAVS